MIGWEGQVRAASIVLHTLAIMPTIRVTDRQTTTALDVHGHIRLRTLARHDDYEKHRRRSCRRLRCRPKRTVPSDEDAIEYQFLEPLLVCSAQVRSEEGAKVGIICVFEGYR